MKQTFLKKKKKSTLVQTIQAKVLEVQRTTMGTVVFR